ncbi:hypothetical protein B0H16DRAFT_1805033, partial [Mycena metata]
LPHLLDPIVDAILESENPDTEPIKTYTHPEGVKVPARIIPLIADLAGSNEAGGFYSHTATCFCSWCKLKLNERGRLDIEAWEKRNGAEVLEQAKKWLDAVTKTEKARLGSLHGVRGTSLHKCEYRDAVWHTILGILHNWIEGNLQHHLRHLWGIGRPAKINPAAAETDAESKAPEGPEGRGEDSGMESQESGMENQESDSEENSASTHRGETPVSSTSSRSRSRSSTVEDPDRTPRGTPAPEHAPRKAGQQAAPKKGKKSKKTQQFSFDFSDAELQEIRAGIKNISLPSWVPRPPINLGESSHGKLKADLLLYLFIAILPLIIPAILIRRGDLKNLENFYNLVAASNVLLSFKTSNSEARAFMDHYKAYRSSKKEIFPDWADRPNHHYSMHYEDLLMYWGPMVSLAEWAGERMNGMLQNIKTNNHMSDMDFTMLRDMTRLCRLLAFLEDSESDIAGMDVFARILEPRNPQSTTQVVNDSEQATYLHTRATPLESEIYEMILKYLNSSGHLGQWQSHLGGFHHPRALVLPPLAKRCASFYEKGRLYSRKDPGNLIQFHHKLENMHRTGVIHSIFEIPLQGKLQKFILVAPHNDLSEEEVAETPYDPSRYPRFLSKIVEVQPSANLLLIEPEHIITHITAHKVSGQDFGIERELLLVCWALDRGR